MTTSAPAPLTADPSAPLRVLAWDAPNIDFALGKLLGERKPEPNERPRWDALARWLVGRAAPHEDVEATVFLNVGQVTPQLRDWVQVLRELGFGVFGKPRAAGSDIDRDLLDYLWGRLDAGPVAEVLIASGDQFREFEDSIEQLAERTRVTVLGFAESNPAARTVDGGVEFVDLESIPGLFEVALPRDTLAVLPPQGRWLRPLRSLREAVGQAQAAAPAPPPAPTIPPPGTEPDAAGVGGLLRRVAAGIAPTPEAPGADAARAKAAELLEALAAGHDEELGASGLPLAHLGLVFASLAPGFAPREHGFDGFAGFIRAAAVGTPLALFRGERASDVWLGLRAHPPQGAITRDPDPEPGGDAG
ncbi:MAG TPA: hypothetical protein VNT51_13280 [Miltoncostaeaceae bacterium]|nr:hypothetical protein [Miltoncostaeaceae bacterium]